MTADQAALLAEVTKTFDDNISEIETALQNVYAHQYVHVWPGHWLAIKCDGVKSQVCGVARATITTRSDRRVFTNGKNENALLMPRARALRFALEHARKIKADFAAL